MNRIHVAAHFAKQLNVALGHGLLKALVHAGFQIFEVIGHVQIPSLAVRLSGRMAYHTSARIAAFGSTSGTAKSWASPSAVSWPNWAACTPSVMNTASMPITFAPLMSVSAPSP